jgi:hypothetical protein
VVQAAVYLIAQQPCIDRTGDPGNLLQKFPVHQGACRVVGVVDTDEFCIFIHHAAQFVQVGQKCISAAQGQDVNFSAQRLRNRIMLLVSGQHGDHLVPRPGQCFNHKMIRTDSPVRRNNILRCLFFIQSGNEHPQARAAFNRTVGQLHAEDIGHSLLTAAAKLQKLLHGQGFHTGLRQIISTVVFIGVHPHLNAKVLDFHCFPIPCLIDNIFTEARRKYWPQQSWILSDPPGNPAPLPQDC